MHPSRFPNLGKSADKYVLCLTLSNFPVIQVKAAPFWFPSISHITKKTRLNLKWLQRYHIDKTGHYNSPALLAFLAYKLIYSEQEDSNQSDLLEGFFFLISI